MKIEIDVTEVTVVRNPHLGDVIYISTDLPSVKKDSPVHLEIRCNGAKNFSVDWVRKNLKVEPKVVSRKTSIGG